MVVKQFDVMVVLVSLSVFEWWRSLEWSLSVVSQKQCFSQCNAEPKFPVKVDQEGLMILGIWLGQIVFD